ncbi:MAG TPA: PKD domain-containing protein, partial [Candidatus Omnitrophica bacterium]|nr:PKD domain-containing protein [Candidatus Omnitrophota bacterium]
VKFDGRNSRDRDGDELSYTWDFGDGSSGKGERVTHIYHKGGKYKVTLEVCDGTATKCSCSRDSITVTLNKPPVAKAGKDIKTCKGSEVTFDGSGSYTESGETLSYFWDFGDGSTASGEKVTHTYTRGGTYKVVLTVDDGQNAPNSRTSDVINVMVNSSPYVSLRAVEPVCVGTEVAFDASDSGDPDRDRLVYIWDFGDGTTLVAGAKVKHKYEKGGIYNVKVTVDDGKGTSCSKISDSIKLRVNTPPVADAGRDKVVCMGCAIVFDGTKSYDPDGDSLVYTWNFGDGATAEGAKVTHIYDKPGKYEVTLTVSDGSETPCNFSVDKIKVTVNAPPVPIIKVK